MLPAAHAQNTDGVASAWYFDPVVGGRTIFSTTAGTIALWAKCLDALNDGVQHDWFSTNGGSGALKIYKGTDNLLTVWLNDSVANKYQTLATTAAPLTPQLIIVRWAGGARFNVNFNGTNKSQVTYANTPSAPTTLRIGYTAAPNAYLSALFSPEEKDADWVARLSASGLTPYRDGVSLLDGFMSSGDMLAPGSSDSYGVMKA